jgi:8-oxo-dGTP pyrophosphatase MutT (NUDIX family)
MTYREKFKGYVSEQLKSASVEVGYSGDLEFSPHLQHSFERSALKEAAVLILLSIYDDRVSILLTKRADHLRTHPGEWCFPGGKQDEDDESKIHTALREANEEIGLQIDNVNVLGQLPDYHVRKGFNVTPVIGMIKQPMTYDLNRDEVAALIELPLCNLYKPENSTTVLKTFNGHAINLRRFEYDGQEISGATAGMLMMFATTIALQKSAVDKRFNLNGDVRLKRDF